ncbi:MAG: transposase, partial [Leptospirales bacterium]|nr:transposase [Leptospirales bacterium]
MKRRVQLLASDQMVRVKTLIRNELEKSFKDYRLPPEGTDLTAIRKRKPIVHADTVVLFSASQRANKGRKNYRNRGLTASIYLQDRLGGKQIGTLVHVMGTEKGWCLLDSVPDQKANTLGPLIRESIPLSTPVFTDEGYKWLWGIYRNHRAVNHSLKSKDNRWRFSRQRWCRNGVHNQVAEGLNSSLKSAMTAYRYFRPEYSQLYLS